ncbi:unnamed protein product [Ranitomeya imitator]|uniref:Uncharacterized protein n=1 Tax=Ranitomeya imitator TaxID=111125 RepID=A0ABN9L183_9NEOB|nr:unnamed protein product [Ranitomeya imitator]
MEMQKEQKHKIFVAKNLKQTNILACCTAGTTIVVILLILELAKRLMVDPRVCSIQFFTKIKTADR